MTYPLISLLPFALKFSTRFYLVSSYVFSAPCVFFYMDDHDDSISPRPRSRAPLRGPEPLPFSHHAVIREADRYSQSGFRSRRIPEIQDVDLESVLHIVPDRFEPAFSDRTRPSCGDGCGGAQEGPGSGSFVAVCAGESREPCEGREAMVSDENAGEAPLRLEQSPLESGTIPNRRRARKGVPVHLEPTAPRERPRRYRTPYERRPGATWHLDRKGTDSNAGGSLESRNRDFGAAAVGNEVYCGPPGTRAIHVAVPDPAGGDFAVCEQCGRGFEYEYVRSDVLPACPYCGCVLLDDGWESFGSCSTADATGESSSGTSYGCAVPWTSEDERELRALRTRNEVPEVIDLTFTDDYADLPCAAESPSEEVNSYTASFDALEYNNYNWGHMLRSGKVY